MKSIYELVDTPLPISVNQCLRVRFTSKAVAAPFQLTSELSEVIDGSIENDSDLSVRRDHWLMTRFTQVEDCESAVSQNGVRPGFHTFAVRTTTRQGFRHPPDD